MSHFLRQFHVISSLKSGSEADILKPFYKAIAPIVPLPPCSKALHTKVLDKNLVFQSQVDDSSESEKRKVKRPLAIVLSWMSAKGNHIDKYCNIYLQRGFDVLTVHITPQQLLFPTTGSQVVAANILKYIDSHTEFDRILIHAFSVGAYLMGEVFVKLQESKTRNQNLNQRIIGMILDSAVDVQGLSTAFPRAVAKNPLTVKVLEWYVNAHMEMMHNIATKHYLKASESFHNTPLHCPALLFVSKADKVGTPAVNQVLADNWIAKGVDVKLKCFEKSQHVSHMYFYKDEYVREIDSFISKLKQKGSL